jgi:long-chain fatty acid transport protein
MPFKHTLRLGSNRQPHFAALAAALFLGVVAGPNLVFGLGIALPDQDAFATARGNAFVATANDPAAVFYNPAGLSQLPGVSFSVGAYGIEDGDRFSGRGGSLNSKSQWSAVPQFFSSYSLSNYNLTFGFGTYAPFGLRQEWPNNAPFGPQTGQITYLTASPVVAWQIVPSFTIAAGATFNYSEAELETTGYNLHGHATDAGYIFGALFQPAPQHSIGVTFHSATEMNYNGHELLEAAATTPVVAHYPGEYLTLPASADFHYPCSVAGGYSFRPNENWNLETDLTWSQWSSFKSVSILPFGPPLAFDWSDSIILGAGVTRYFGSDWRVSGGYMYSMNSVPDANFNPLVPDSDRHVFSIGVGKKYGHFSWDAAYQLAWGPSRSISDESNPIYPYGIANGKYEFLSHALTINFGYHF